MSFSRIPASSAGTVAGAVTVDGDVAHFERSAGADDDSIEPPHARCVDFAHVHETLVDAVAGRERVAAGGHQQS